MKKILTLLLFVVASAMCFAQTANINLSATTAFEGEPFVAVNPTNTQNIIVAWMAIDLSTTFRVAIKTKTSFDGGATWGNQKIQPHFGSAWHSADVSMGFRPNGTVYLSYVDYRQSPDSGGDFMTYSLDGGITWSTPVQVVNGAVEDSTKKPLDRPWMAVDNSGTANDGMLYLTTKPAPWIPAGTNRPYLKTSSDSGQTWSPFRYIDTTGYLVGSLIAQPMAAVTTTHDGALCVAYPTYVATQNIYPVYYFAKSYSRGATFQYYNLLVNPSAVADTNYKLGYRLVSNPSNANQLAFAYIGNQNGDPDIFVTTTNNGGVTWNNSVRVNDDAVANGKAQDMVWASYNSKGDLALAWRDRRNGSGTGFTQASDTYSAVSHDNGATFQPNIRLSSMTSPFDTILAQSGNDFLGCQLVNDTIYSAWADIRSGNLNIYFTKTSDSTGISSGVVQVASENSMQLHLYPNPSSKQLFVSVNPSDKRNVITELKIYDANGKEVMHKSILNLAQKGAISIDISSLSAGSYLVKATADNQNYSERIIVGH